jgi:hypothetical protein
MSGRICNVAQTALLTLIFQNTAYANVGNAGGLQPSSAAGSFFISLNTADPGAAGTLTTSESAYTNYAEQSVARSSGGWTITGTSPATAENAAAVTFPACGATGSTVTWFQVGLTSGGNAMFQGSLTASLIINAGITPSFAINALQCTLD